MTSSNLNVANAISAARILMVPALIYLASDRRATLFAALLAAALLMDILDGYLARRLNQQTRLGAQLDSWGDFLTVLVYPYAALCMRPEETRHHATYAAVAAGAYFVPIIFGFIKFRRLTSYHTRLMTVTAYVMGAAMIIFFAGGSAVPFDCGCVLLVTAQAEELAISTILPRWRENVPSFRHARSAIDRDAPAAPSTEEKNFAGGHFNA